MTIQILFPLTDKQARACVVAADRFGVEPWEMAVHALEFRRRLRAKKDPEETPS